MIVQKLDLSCLFLLTASLAFGQTGTNLLTITASRPNTQQPDQAVFAVTVTSPLTASLNAVIAALAGSGITAADLSSLSNAQILNPDGSQNCVPGLQWTFTLAAPFSKMKDTASLLTGIQQKIGQTIPGSGMSFGVQGVRVSPELQASQQCSIADLIADARAKAGALANAAGATVGPIVALSDGGTGSGSVAGYFRSAAGPSGPLIPSNACTVGFSGTSSGAFGSAPSCTIVVKFSLMYSQ